MPVRPTYLDNSRSKIISGQGPIVVTVGAGGGGLDTFSLVYHFSFLSPSVWETA